MRRLTARVLWAGGLCGAAAGAALFAGRRSVPGWFTSDPAVIGALQRGGVWEVLAATQPLNGLLFVFDGLMYSTQARRRPGRACGVSSVHPPPGGLLPAADPPTILAPDLCPSSPPPLQAFTYVRNYMALGFALVFCPALAAAAWAAPPGTGLAAIWLAKGALNVWRLGGAAYLIYWRFLPRFGQGGGAAAGEAAAEPAA